MISRVTIWGSTKPIRYQVDMFFLYYSHPFYKLSSEIDLRKNPHLRLLQFCLHLDRSEFRKSQDDVIRWFNSICESVTSKSLVVEVRGFTEEVEICDKIQDTLFALRERIETFSVYLAPGTKGDGLFSKLYEAGIVVEEDIWTCGDRKVSCILTFYLLHSSVLFLASPSFPPVSFYSTPKVFLRFPSKGMYDRAIKS